MTEQHETERSPLVVDSRAVVAIRRIEYIDAIRGIASVMVLIDHAVAYWVPAYRDWSLQYLNLGRVGITAFFLVSGYVVGLTLTKQPIRTFALRRFWRLYPVYWLTTAFYVGVLAAGGDAPLDFSLFVIAINLTMLQGFIGVVSILGPAWTLGVEVAYYAQAVAAKALGILPRASWLGYLWLAGFLAMAVSNVALGSDFTALAPLMLYTASLGYALYVKETQDRNDLLRLLLAGGLVVPLGSIALLQAQAGEPWSWMAFVCSFTLGCLFFGLFYLARRISMPQWLLWLGAISYALYLVHISVIELVARLGAAPIPSVLIVLAGSVALGGLLHRFVEQPMIALGRRLTPSSKPVS